MSAFENFLLERSDYISADDIERYADKAAVEYVSNNVSLNSTITKIAEEYSLNCEQVKRVVEKANNKTFNLMLKAGYDKNITFDVADASLIKKDSPKKDKSLSKTASNLSGKTSNYFPGQEYETELYDMFKVASSDEDIVKEASEYDLRVKSAYDSYMEKRAAEDTINECIADLNILLHKVGSEIKDLKGMHVNMDSVGKFTKENSKHAHKLLFDSIEDTDDTFFNYSMKEDIETIDSLVDKILVAQGKK